MTISLTPPTGTLTYERALSMTVSLSNVAIVLHRPASAV